MRRAVDSDHLLPQTSLAFHAPHRVARDLQAGLRDPTGLKLYLLPNHCKGKREVAEPSKRDLAVPAMQGAR